MEGAVQTADVQEQRWLRAASAYGVESSSAGGEVGSGDTCRLGCWSEGYRIWSVILFCKHQSSCCQWVVSGGDIGRSRELKLVTAAAVQAGGRAWARWWQQSWRGLPIFWTYTEDEADRLDSDMTDTTHHHAEGLWSTLSSGTRMRKGEIGRNE